jgi:hypothetical protein
MVPAWNRRTPPVVDAQPAPLDMPDSLEEFKTLLREKLKALRSEAWASEAADEMLDWLDAQAE